MTATTTKTPVLIGFYHEQRGERAYRYRVQVEIALENGRLSITGTSGRALKSGVFMTDQYGDPTGGSGGQIVDELRRVTEFAPGWSRARRNRLVAIWEHWHLNDMRAGCEHQRAAGWDKRPIDPSKPLNSYGLHFPGQRLSSWNMLTWVSPDEHPDGLMTKKCEVCGYGYGTAWLREELPADVVEFVESITNNEKVD